MNYPGYGGSSGGAKLDDIPPAALATYDDLRKRAGGDAPIFVCGNSLGTASALYIAANRPVAGLILQNPPPLRRLLMQNYGWWNLWLAAGPVALQVPAQLNATTTAPHCTAPAIFLSADGDEVVPPKYHRLVYDAYKGEKRLIELPGATHGSSVKGDAEQQLQEGMDWLWEKRDRAAP
jgi:pimeloyl-ACP methyl ester carboxylesterase